MVLLELVECVAVAADTEGKGGLRELVEYVAVAADTEGKGGLRELVKYVAIAAEKNRKLLEQFYDRTTPECSEDNVPSLVKTGKVSFMYAHCIHAPHTFEGLQS